MRYYLQKKNAICLFCMLVILPSLGYSQTLNCDSLLRALQQKFNINISYDYNEIVPCIPDLNFDQKIEAYELLMEYKVRQKERAEVRLQSVLQRETDSLYIEILKIYPEYALPSSFEKNDRDSLEKNVNRNAKFSLSFYVGANASLVRILRPYEIDIAGNSAENYQTRFSETRPVFGVGINYPISKLLNGLQKSWYSPLQIGIEFWYLTNTFYFQRPLHFSSIDSLNFTTLSFTESQRRIDIPILLKFRSSIGKSGKFFVAVQAGASANFLVGAKLKSLSRSNTNTLPGSPDVGVQDLKDVSVLDQRTRFNYAFIGSIGIRYKLTTGLKRKNISFLSLDLRYQNLLKNQVRNRFLNKELNYLYGFGQSDFGISQVSLVIGYSPTFFNPRSIKQSPITNN